MMVVEPTAGAAADDRTPAASNIVVHVGHLQHSFTDRAGLPAPVVDGVSFDLRAGQFVSIIGPSGCGKTTVLNIVAGLERLQAGDISILDQPPRAGRPDVSVSFARDALLPWRNALDNVAVPLELRGVKKRDRHRRAAEMLELVGLGEHAQSFRSQLSQGQRQRVALARALVSRPRVLVLDEPFAALDSQTRVVVQSELVRLLEAQEFPVTTLMVTHDLHEAVALSDLVIQLSRRPARIREIYPIDLPRPRDAVALRSDAHFQALYDRIWGSLAEDVVAEEG